MHLYMHQDLQKLFESFQQVDTRRNRNVEGTGLGLGLVKGILNLMDSKLEVESEYGKGSTFKFTISQDVTSLDPIGEIDFDESDVDEEEFLRNKDALVKVFDIVGGELHRKKIYRTKSATYFFFDIYHIISDGVSLNIMCDEIMHVYNEEGCALNNDYYYEIMASNIKEENEETIDRRKVYEEKCNKIVESNDFSTMPNFDFDVKEGKAISEKKIFNIVKEEKNKNKYFRSISNNEFFIGALALAISKYNSTKNVCFHWVYNGRDNEKYNNTVGYFLKYLPLFIMFDSEKSIEEYFSDIREQVTYGIVNNKLPYSVYENPKIINTIYIRYQNNLLNIIYNVDNL